MGVASLDQGFSYPKRMIRMHCREALRKLQSPRSCAAEIFGTTDLFLGVRKISGLIVLGVEVLIEPLFISTRNISA